MGKIIACIDGSAHANSVCALSVWAAERSGLPISLLHVVTPHSGVTARGELSGTIGLGAKSSLLDELTKMDEEHGKLEQKKGQLILAHAKSELAASGINQTEVLHRRGSLVDTLTELPGTEIIVMGKRGEHENSAPDHLGSNLERVARAIKIPLLVAVKKTQPITRFLLAYDGSVSTNKAVEYAIKNPLLKGLECHMLKVGEQTAEAEAILKQAADKLIAAGFSVRTTLQQGKSVETLVKEYIAAQDIHLLVIGAYGHSKIRSLILGSTTTALIRKSNVPVLLFR